MKALVIFSLFLFGVSCSDKQNVSAINEAVTIFYQKTTSFDNGVSVRLSSVQESRCPEGVQCVRAGELFATLGFELGNAKTEATFCVSGECVIRKDIAPKSTYYSGGEVTVGSKKYRVEITDFSPEIASQSIELNAYSLTLKLIE